MLVMILIYLSSFDVDSGPQGPCVVAVINKFTQTTDVLWRKRDGTSTLSVREKAPKPA